MLERENIDNFIADDLALRNRNWGQIEDELDARYTKGETDGLLAGKADLADSLTMENLITNGDFSQGTEGWSYSGGTPSTSENVCSITGDGSGSTIRAFQVVSNYNWVLGDVLFVKITSKAVGGDADNISTSLRENSGTGTIVGSALTSSPLMEGVWSNQTFTVTNSTASGTAVGFNLTYGFGTPENQVEKIVSVKNAIIINLTDTFGAGNEPTEPEMNEIIELLGGWFNGEITVPQKTLASWLLNDIRLKADKQQEAWITPTLLNGATATDAGYYKDSVGIVRLRGTFMVTGSYVQVFRLPAGYRPSTVQTFAVYNNIPLPSGATCRVANSGTVHITAFADTQWVDISSVQFRVAEG